MRYLIVLMAVFGWLTITSSVAQACSCLTPGTPCESYGTADAVFVGTVVSVQDPQSSKSGDVNAWRHQRVFKFSVEQSYLGVKGTEVEILTASDGTACGYDFRIGERYLVYAHSYGNRLSTSICTRTRSLTSASEDLAFLGNLSSAAPGVSIYGEVVYRKAKSGAASLPSSVVVKIEGGDVSREIHPDPEGKFRVSGLPPGKFKVTLLLPETLSAHLPEREITVADRGCGSVTYYVSEKEQGRLQSEGMRRYLATRVVLTKNP
jgi:Tissue inhibitor of metalloproteinase